MTGAVAKKATRWIISGLVFAVCLGLAGCSSDTEVHSVSYGNVGWNAGDGGQMIPGVDQAMLAWYWSDDRLCYVVWTDLPGGVGSAGSRGGTIDGVLQQRAELSASDGTHFEFTYTANFGSSGPLAESLTIAGVPYEMSDRRCLLVSTRDSQPTVLQIEIPPTIRQRLQDDSLTREQLIVDLRDIAADRGDIRNFFEGLVPKEFESTENKAPPPLEHE